MATIREARETFLYGGNWSFPLSDALDETRDGLALEWAARCLRILIPFARTPNGEYLLQVINPLCQQAETIPLQEFVQAVNRLQSVTPVADDAVKAATHLVSAWKKHRYGQRTLYRIYLEAALECMLISTGRPVELSELALRECDAIATENGVLFA
jgi:hypothetical protein